ncbi:unnamed protein product [Closterium sp. Yama58-4]|nr:unnamed protein product [Closterium sp. Yama58-4]
MFFREVLEPFLSNLGGRSKLLLAGDLNVVEDLILDKSPSGGPCGENERLTFYARATKSSSRVDRIVVPGDLLSSVTAAAHTHPLKGISDHKFGIRVVLQANLRLHMGPGNWRLLSADTAKPGVERVARAVTERHRAGKSGNFGTLLTKLKAALRRYTTEERKRLRATLRHLELAVSGLQHAVMREPHRDDLWTDLLEKEAQLEAYLKGENERLHLLAGVREETKGEIALKVLFGRVKSKKTRTMIPALSVQGVEQKGTKGIMEAASGFYAELFAEAPPLDVPCWKPDVGKTLRGDEVAELDADWSEEEVKAVLSGMARDKSPWNDGLPKELFERHWDLLKEDFMRFVKRSYKVVAKLLANRMKKVLGTVISEEQHGFLPGRRLSDAAFKSVSRSFLFDTMALMGFPEKFIGWCRGLHGGSFIRLLLNEWLGDRVDVCKGVRQRCPLAPYLFLCAVEPICQEAKRKKLGICEDHGDRLAYLGYADDTTLVLKGKQQIGRAEALLEEFEARSGLRVNQDKLGKNLETSKDREGHLGEGAGQGGGRTDEVALAASYHDGKGGGGECLRLPDPRLPGSGLPVVGEDLETYHEAVSELHFHEPCIRGAPFLAVE